MQKRLASAFPILLIVKNYSLAMMANKRLSPMHQAKRQSLLIFRTNKVLLLKKLMHVRT
jgi:hypothetical protein